MFHIERRKSGFDAAVSIAELIYHATVRDLRKQHGNAIVGLLLNILQSVIFVSVFYVMFSLLGLKGSAIRGDFVLYIMSGVFLFMTHTKTMRAIVSAEGPSSAMMQHAPMNTIISICSAALSALYLQILSVLVILFVAHVALNPIYIMDPIGALGMLLISWFSGVGVGIVFLALKPWFPQFVTIGSTIYMRANMIASGKMFVANSLPGFMLSMFDWNPLFHAIDQARGFIFVNYNPHFSSIEYPVYVSIALIMLGLMGEFYTRKHASVSWGAGK